MDSTNVCTAKYGTYTQRQHIAPSWRRETHSKRCSALAEHHNRVVYYLSLFPSLSLSPSSPSSAPSLRLCLCVYVSRLHDPLRRVAVPQVSEIELHVGHVHQVVSVAAVVVLRV